MQHSLIIYCTAFVVAQLCIALPVTKTEQKPEPGPEDARNKTDHAANISTKDLGYDRYLSEVLHVLDKDPEFTKKIANASPESILSGDIATELDFLHHGLRSQLDEIKRREIDRLIKAATQQYEQQQQQGHDKIQVKIPEHLNHENPHTFEVIDLKKLIRKTTADLNEVDKQRRKDFKEYEMQKNWEQEQKMKQMTEEQKKKYQDELHQVEEKHKQHKPLHHPGSKQQYEEVWEKQDHMEYQDFDPRAFFKLHDVDGNGYWDPYEVNALFIKELDKAYQQGDRTMDVRERNEEMERMREHVFAEADYNKDGLISYAEFLEHSRTSEFDKDEGWKTVEEDEIYTKEDYERYQEQQLKNLEKQIASGISPPAYGSYDPGHPQQFAPQFAAHADYGQAQGHPMNQQIPVNQQQPYQGQFQNQPQYQNVPQYQGYQQVPQYQGQIPPQQYQQMPQQQVPVPQRVQVPIQQQIPQVQQQQLHQQGGVPVQQQQIPQHGQVQQQQLPQQGGAPVQQQQIPQHQAQQHLPQQGQIPVQQVPIQHVPVQQTHQQIPAQQAQPSINEIPHGQNDLPAAGKGEPSQQAKASKA